MHKSMIILVLLTAALVVSGCGTLQQAAKKGVEAGTEANDSAVRAAVFTLCRGASVGSIRRFFDTPEKSQVWRDLCSEDPGFSLEEDTQ